VDRHWEAFFGIDGSLWDRRGLTVIKHVGLGDYRGIWFFHRREHWIVSAPEDWVDRLRGSLETVDPASLLEEAILRSLVGDAFDRSIGPAFRGYLEPRRFQRMDHPSVRPVVAADRPLVAAIKSECEASGWNPLEQGTHWQHAVFAGDRIVALAGCRFVGDAADPFVFTASTHRRQGLGVAVVSATVDQAMRAGKLLLYQTLQSNEGAVRVALRLGFEQDSTHVSVRLRF
jgi:GNAT superfamily N-acetyltransferase